VDAHQQQVENAIQDPTRYYARPMDVVHDDALDTEEKRRILESWKQDAQLLSTAQDENMAGGERPHLQDVSMALSELERLSAAS
jgi:hypothetical protein